MTNIHYLVAPSMNLNQDSEGKNMGQTADKIVFAEHLKWQKCVIPNLFTPFSLTAKDCLILLNNARARASCLSVALQN